MSEEFFVTPDEQRVYDSIVRPNAIVPVPGYFLERWVPLLGASRAWLALAFRQVAFVSRCETQETPLTTTLRRLGKWSGLTHVRVHQLMQDPFHLTWFVRPREGDLSQHPGPRSKARDYLVRVDVPLTPKDQLRLRSWLKAQSPTDDREWLSVIEEGMSARELDILPKTKLPQEPATVQQIVSQLRDASTPLPPSLDQACTELHARWVQPDRVSLVTHYFIQQWLPDLSSGLGWLVVLLRTRAYHEEPRAQVGQVWSSGGWSQLADTLGSSRRSVSRWRSLKEARLFYTQVENEKDPGNRRSLLLSVRLSEPIHPEHQKDYEQLLHSQDLTKDIVALRQELTSSSLSSGQTLPILDPLLSHNLTNESYPQNLPLDFSQGLTNPEQDFPRRGQNLPDAARFEQNPDRIERVKRLKDSSKISRNVVVTENNTAENSSEKHYPGILDPWNVMDILRQAGLGELPQAKKLIDKAHLQHRFIGWMLFGMGQAQIKYPALFGIKRMEEADPPETYLKLVEHPPSQVIGWLQDALWEKEVPVACQVAIKALRSQSAQDKMTAYGIVGFSREQLEVLHPKSRETLGEPLPTQDLGEAERLEAIAGQLWGLARDQLQMELPRTAFETWVRDVEAETVEQDTLVLTASNAFARDWLEDRLVSTAQRVLTGIAGKPMQIRFILHDE